MTDVWFSHCHCGKLANDYGNGIEYICDVCFTAWQGAGEPEECPCGLNTLDLDHY